MSVTGTAKKDYILGHDERELVRLDAQAAAWEPATRRALAAVGIAPGARCLDVGCGTGSVMRILAELTGPAGRITGADANAELGELAVARLNAAGPAVFAFQPLDVTTAATVDGGPYDLVFARLLMSHMTDPVTVLRRLWSFVAPGGALLVQDYDQTVAAAAPEQEAVRDALRLVAGAFAATGKSPRVGNEMPAHFVAAGIGAPDGIDVFGQILPARQGCAMLSGVTRSLAPLIETQGLARRDEVDRLVAAIDALADRPGQTVRIPDMIATWKRKQS